MDSNRYSFSNIFKSSYDFFSKNFSLMANIMMPSILMQIVGIYISLTPAQYVRVLSAASTRDMSGYLVPVFICAIIGLVIFASGFWKYVLVTYQMVLASDDYSESKPLNFEYYNNEILNRRRDYIKMLMWTAFYLFIGMIGIMILLSVLGMFKNPFSAILAVLIEIGVIVWLCIKSALVTQIFAFKKEIAPKDILRGSFEYSKGFEGIIFAILVVMVLIGVILQIIISLISLPLTVLGGTNIAFVNAVDFILSSAVLFLLPFNMSVFTLLYKRIEKK